MGLRGKMQHRVDGVAFHAVNYLCRMCDVPPVEGEVGSAIEEGCIVERRAVVKLVKGDDVVGARISQREMAHKPTGT